MRKNKFTFFMVLSLAQLGFCNAASFVVGSGDEVNTTQVLSDPGDTGLIEVGGTINLANPVVVGPGVEMQNDDQVVTNRGTIRNAGFDDYGIYNNMGANAKINNSGLIQTIGTDGDGIFSDQGNNAKITNSGTIETTGGNGINDGAHGIRNRGGANVSVTSSGVIKTQGDGANGIRSFQGDNAHLTNSGLIKTTGGSASGISNQEGNNAKITNSGVIETKEKGSNGIFNFESPDATITNSGTIYTKGESAIGIANDGSSNSTIVNTGTIQTKGLSAHGIYNNPSDAGPIPSNDVTVSNCGLVSVTGEDAHGVRSDATEANFHLINAGTISSKRSLAINLLGDNPMLTVVKCSKIIGPVHSTSGLNVNTKKGVNLLLTLDDTSAQFGNLDIKGVYAVKGRTLAVVDPRSFVMEPDLVADLSDTLLNGVDNPCYACDCGCDCSIWAQGIGYARERGKDCDRYEFHQGGFLVGLDSSLCEGTKLSLFGGAVFGRNNKKECDVCLKSDNYVGGLRLENCHCNGSFSYSGIFGSLCLDQNRPVFFNLAADGILDAKSNRSGFFTAQEVNLQRCFSVWCLSPEVTATVRYAGFFPGRYKEKRDTFPVVCANNEEDLALNKQSFNFIVTRMLVGLPLCTTCPGKCLKVEPYLGAAGRFQLDSRTQKGKLLGESICFSNYLPRNIASFLFGIKGCYSLCGLECSLNLEGDVEGAHGSRFVGTGGVSYSY